ncbi:hypothetical protein FOXG_22115 [Fusarium oxysporum f. sp. lycopersici 4287]|uniref:Uncharacterized protein n=2 Tax=Fusarium oxysporum TaxID=5507 RepID=A0A0J9W5I1_FUSO4|nr:hypothetical protein FOXG_22115 [Fusarium oxysporum f. sp. lycopersici 4287]EXK28046.1 hypothetical protein FOMG_15508 [Fusarium oxysporum f. sp. melonis 26406]KNB18021.1 hypothetical protein FOXG_22115 [Fusarium oxysporum f. sp. lycopersici 4287]
MRQRTAPCVKVLAMAASLNEQIFGRIGAEVAGYASRRRENHKALVLN